MIEKIVWIVLFVLCFPWLVFVSVKLGTYAFFRGKNLFEQEEKCNGEKQKIDEASECEAMARRNPGR